MNIISTSDNPQKLPNQLQQFCVLSFYVFSAVPHCSELQQQIRNLTSQLGLKGTVILATEGANGSVAGEERYIQQFTAFIKQQWHGKNLKYTCTAVEQLPFKRMLVKIKPEIVTLRHGEVPAEKKTGVLVDPEKWNQLLDDQDCQIVDVRNRYETAIGKFPRALDPSTDNFSQFPSYASKNLNRDKKVAMYCTGGIRCEKASSYLLEQGFKEVYQLQGGILNYLRKIPAAQQRWCGKCFVFDQRQEIDKATPFLEFAGENQKKS